MLKGFVAGFLVLIALVAIVQWQPPTCWEDEVRVLILSRETSLLGCVPLDNLPVTGARP